ncbi:Hypothetical predicted protein [Olea europaea subsp. europaea]|uniref:Uncharacterized protein n=1 Tax=Olea europaea subsp. europaea TaxID=158383 RepID=A0A8S0U3C4_OLEEU|nr:Hypothetical predicted protein [Olea europaea subsp. europaea]
MNYPEVGEVDDGDVRCACHLRKSLRKSIYGNQLRKLDGVDSSGDSVMDKVDVVEADVGTNDQAVEQIWETSTSDIPCSVENEAGVEVANDRPDRFAEPSTIRNATVDQSSAFEDPGNAPILPSVEKAINAQNTGTRSSGGESEVEEEVIGLEHFSDAKYEREDEEEDDQGKDTIFRLSEGLDFGLGNVGNKGPNQQNVNVNAVNSSSDCGDSDDLRSMSSGDEAGTTSNSGKEVWFNPSTDMVDPKFQIG